jgi:hypothetical protein
MNRKSAIDVVAPVNYRVPLVTGRERYKERVPRKRTAAM